MRFTKEIRQEIIREFCLKRNAEFDAKLFEQEVRETGPSHRAYEWFEWDEQKAAEEYRVWQARAFANGLRVNFTISEIGRGAVHVRTVEAPMLMSPLNGRADGGGYFITDPNNPAHIEELCRQAATDLSRWLRRYEAALVHAGGSTNVIRKQLALLESKLPKETEEEAA